MKLAKTSFGHSENCKLLLEFDIPGVHISDIDAETFEGCKN